MNNENPNVENVQETVTSPVVGNEAPVLNTVDPTASFETVDPTAVADPVVTEAPVVVSTTPNQVEELVPEQPSSVPSTVPRPTTSSNITPPAPDTGTRYNPVTGEEVNMNALLGKPEEPVQPVVAEEPKNVEAEYKPPSKARIVLLVLFFIALIVFIAFLPDIQTMIALYKAGPTVVEEITTVPTTEAVTELNEQCTNIKANVAKMSGISVSCEYENGLLTEKESFDYATYDAEEVSAAYTEAGGSMLEFQKDEDIDLIMTNMRQGGFTCNKEK